MALTVEMLNRYKDIVRENIKAWPQHIRLKNMSRNLTEPETYLICQIKAVRTLLDENPGLEVVLDAHETESVWID